MTASAVYLEDGHVCCCTAEEEEDKDGGDWNVNVFIGDAAERPHLRSVRWSS